MYTVYIGEYGLYRFFMSYSVRDLSTNNRCEFMCMQYVHRFMVYVNVFVCKQFLLCTI